LSWAPADRRAEIEAALRRAGGLPDEALDLAGTALLLAALERPAEPLEHYREHLALLGRETAELAGAAAAEHLEARLEALNGVLVERHGYAGDGETYDDLRNADLMAVIERRRGLPVALGILYLHAARSQGWAAVGLAFPGHFLLRLDCGPRRAILDPFNRGQLRQPAELRELLKAMSGVEAELSPHHYAPVSNRDVLLRLQNNRKLRLLREHRGEAALAVVEGMLMVAPGVAGLWREAGLLHAHHDNLRAAILALEHYLGLAGEDPQRAEAERLLRQLRGRLN